MNNLEIFTNKFKEWRGDRRHYRYPKHFWDEIKQLAKQYPILAIAQALGINLPYLRKKLLQDSETPKFAELNVTIAVPVSIEFIDRNSRAMTIRFQADPEQLSSMILSLSGNMK